MTQTVPSNNVSKADVIRSYFTYIDDINSKNDKELISKLNSFSNPDHLVYNLTKNGTFTDKVSSLKELISVS